jgi:hypothetical protein
MDGGKDYPKTGKEEEIRDETEKNKGCEKVPGNESGKRKMEHKGTCRGIGGRMEKEKIKG